METPEKKIEKIETTLTPNTRKRKSRLADELTDLVEGWELGDDADVEVLLLSLKKLELIGDVRSNLVKEKSVSGRKMTSFETRKLIWDFYHQSATPSTLTSLVTLPS